MAGVRCRSGKGFVMIRAVKGMPPGTVGFEAVGKVSEEDYRTTLVPALSAALEQGGVRLLYVMGDDFESFSPGAVWADTRFGLAHVKGWKRMAVVSDADWLENSVKAFGWLMPGEVKVFETDEVEDAKAWLAAEDDD